ncbi:MAG: molybdate ABC transporter substrate-binding protein [Sphingomonadaceae bacterium]
MKLARRNILALAAGAVVPAAVVRSQGRAAPAIAAAADLQAAVPQIVERFARATGRQVRVAYGSSGTFAQQILMGAPFEMFLSADEGFVAKVAAGGRTQGEGRLYAIGRIGQFQPARSAIAADSALRDLGEAVKDGRLKRFAIANPEHAPYGRAAREAMQRAGIWDAIEPRLVLGENAAQATQFAMSGSAQGGIIPLSLALTPEVARAGRFALIAEDWHKPLRQQMVLLKGAGETARAFFAFMQAPQARAILRRFGFLLPGETPG